MPLALLHSRRTWIALAATFLALSVADVVSTVATLTRFGVGHEMNPLMRALFAGGPATFVVIKLAIATWIAVRFSDAERLISRLGSIRASVMLASFAYAVVLMGLVALNNGLAVTQSPWHWVTYQAAIAMTIPLLAVAASLLIHRVVIDVGSGLRRVRSKAG